MEDLVLVELEVEVDGGSSVLEKNSGFYCYFQYNNTEGVVGS